MGEVFAAWDPLLDREVALKLLSTAGPTSILRFLREARLQARVDHPNVCRILDVDAEDDLPFIAMQRVRGESMASTKLTEPEAVAVMRQIADAIHAAHRMNLIHRDLKPSNILLERSEAGGWVPFVCDFGLAKDLSGETLTLTEETIGTPAFMAPEQLGLLEAPIGTAADIYALGGILHHAMAGSPPPRSSSASELLQFPPGMRPILQRCLAFQPEDRYSSAAALAEDLRRYQDGESLLEARQTLREKARNVIRRSPIAFFIVLTVILAGLFAGAFTLQERKRARAQAQATAEFMARAKDMQYQMRVERMMPPHDLRPAFARIQDQMKDIQNHIAREGELARGPGNLALGWGYLFLRQPQKALEVLEPLQNAHIQTPGLSYALARAHCDAYEDELPSARALGDQAILELKARHLNPARLLLDAEGNGGLEPTDLGRARLETLDGNPEKALGFASSAFEESPDSYESKAWEAEALNDIGFELQKRGSYTEADSFYRRSDQAAQIAQSIGRSDEWALKVQLNRQLASVAMAEWQGKGAAFDLQPAEELADELLALNPDWLPAIADRLTLSWRRAEILLDSKKDPSIEISKGWTLLEAASRLPGAILRLQRDRLNLARIQATYEFRQGRDPREWIDKGLAGSRDDEYTADLLILRAKWEASRGVDPMPDLDRAIAGCQRPTFESPISAGVLATIGEAWLQKAEWLNDSGQAAEAALSVAKEFFIKAKAANPLDQAAIAGLHKVSVLKDRERKSPSRA